MTRIKMISADGGTEIEVNDDRVEHFERKGYTTAGAKPASRSHKPKAIAATLLTLHLNRSTHNYRMKSMGLKLLEVF